MKMIKLDGVALSEHELDAVVECLAGRAGVGSHARGAYLTNDTDIARIDADSALQKFRDVERRNA